MSSNSAHSYTEAPHPLKTLAYSLNPAGFPINSAHEVLSRPEMFLPLLARTIPDDVVIFSKEINGKFVFLGDACEVVLGFTRSDLVNHALSEFLTDSSINSEYLATCWIGNTKLEPSKRRCEILSPSGNKIKLEQWDVPLLYEGILVGLTGVLWKEPGENSSSLDSQEEERLLANASKLSAVERQVVDLVVDGSMNKKIAAQLGVALRTIESRRARAMSKLNVVSLSQLVQCWMNVRRLEEARNSERTRHP